jgi:hypothetical protein
MEDVLPKRKLGWIGIILGVVGVVFILLSLYLLLFAPFTANSKYVILLRKSFYEKVLEKTLLPARLPYQAFVRYMATNEQSEQIYEYGMMGRFVMIDTEGEILVLKDMAGRTWKMKYTPYMAVQSIDYRNLMVSEVRIAPDKTQASQIKYYYYNRNNPEETEPYFYPGDMVMVLWNEGRTLSMILADNKRDPERVIKIEGSYKIPIYKILAK